MVNESVNKIFLHAPIMKSKGSENGFTCVLSDNSVDRDDEIVGYKALKSMADGDSFIAILMDHQNRVENQIGEWVNKRVEEVDGHFALLAEPKFYMSNPKAKMIHDMLVKDGANIGLSIGAIVKDSEDVVRDEKKFTEFTELELLEASFVAIPANKHGRAMAVAKSFTNKKLVVGEEVKIDEVNKMSEEVKIDALEEFRKEFDAKMSEYTSKVDEMLDLLKAEEEAESEAEDAGEEASEEADKSYEVLEAEIADLKEQLSKALAEPVHKSKNDYPLGEEAEIQKGIPVIYS